MRMTNTLRFGKLLGMTTPPNDWRVRLEPMITPVFRAWWRVSRPATLGVRGIACDEAGRVLLVRHGYVKGWHLPGGGVERGETAPGAIAREMAEEGGVQALDLPRVVGLYANHANFAGDHIALFLVECWAPQASAREIAERGFFALDALPEGVTPATRRRLAEVFDGAPASATW
jgi:ADP-ribose pyrophosphatase YjhB (NUDIX family)